MVVSRPRHEANDAYPHYSDQIDGGRRFFDGRLNQGWLEFFTARWMIEPDVEGEGW
jgi:hypothetical protein